MRDRKGQRYIEPNIVLEEHNRVPLSLERQPGVKNSNSDISSTALKSLSFITLNCGTLSDLLSLSDFFCLFLHPQNIDKKIPYVIDLIMSN